jgi:HD-GYP domain-containing protein (c-di-GMP phosphodiesterase class II)
MTTERPYQRAMSMAVAASRINQLSGKSFDPAVVESFNRAYQKGIFNVGSEKKLIIPKNKPQVA